MNGSGRHRRLLLLLVAAVPVAACAKLNPDYMASADTDPGSSAGNSGDNGSGKGTDGDSSAGSQSGGSSGGGTSGSPSGTDGPDPSGPGTDPTVGPTSGHGSSEATGDPQTSGDPSEWSDACRSLPAGLGCADGLTLSSELSCQIGFAEDAEFFCRRSRQHTISMQIEPGNYFFGTPLREDATVTVLFDGDVPIDCVPVAAGWELDVPVNIDLEIRSDDPTSTMLYAREVETLCEVPENCCDVTFGPPACDSPGLLDCVYEEHPWCADTWDTTCIETAVLVCGADCS